jgi:ketosteroid isomerase-like protein
MAVAKTKPDGFDSFMRQREAAARAYVSGDGAPVDRIVPQTGDATFFPPNGGTVQGAERVAARYGKDVKAFSAGGTTQLEVLQSDSAGDLAFWTGYQIAQVTLGGKAMQMKLRVTEVFRFQDGGWKMIHRHADANAAENG